MNKITLVSIIAIGVGLFWTAAYVIADDGIDFDPKIEEYMQEEFNTKDLSKKFALSIDTLDLSGLNLTSTKGLEHFVNLKKLNLSDNVLTDSSFLKTMDQLIELDISFNQFEDIKLNSTNVTKLDLEANRISSINFASKLDRLTYLNLRANNVLDLTPLEKLEQLQYLNLRGNRVKSLDPLADLNSLTNLNARNNQINFIEPILNLPLSERLVINGNDIEDINLLENKLELIEKVDFDKNIQKPLFSKESGVYGESFELELRTAEEDDEIYYTLDGSKPTVKSNKYEGPFEISKEIMLDLPVISNHKSSPYHDGFTFESSDVKNGITVTAVSASATEDGLFTEYSEPVSYTYILNPDLFVNGLPVISLTVDPSSLFDERHGIYVPGVTFEEDNNLWTGNYYQKGREFEREGIVEFFSEDGTFDFRQNIGVRINGRSTRRYPQKSLRLYSRSDYGQSRIYSNIFEDTPYNEFNLLLLRNSGGDNNSTLIRDGLMHELVNDLDVDVQAYKPAVVLINGEYWGIHNIREKFNDDYIDIKYNVKKEDLVLMKVFQKNGLKFEMKSGSTNDQLHYKELISYINRSDMTNNSSLKHIKTYMDLDNFLHYVAYQVYYANTDSFSNNMMLWRKKTDYIPNAPHGHDGRWRWMFFDLDWGMGYGILHKEDDPLTYNMIKHVLADEERMFLFRNLMKNDDVKEQFIKTMLRLLNHNFEPANIKQKIDELTSNIEAEIPNSINRWDNIGSIEEWRENLQVLYTFAEKRAGIIKEHLKIEFDLTDEDISKIEEEVTQQ